MAIAKLSALNANAKTYEQAKNFCNPANTQSSSKESFKEKYYTFTGMYSLFTWFNMQILNLYHNTLKYLSKVFYENSQRLNVVNYFHKTLHFRCLAVF